MRKFAQTSTATALLLSGATTAMAAGIDQGSFGNAQFYWRMGFNELQGQRTSINYGFALDYDRRYSELPGVPAAQVNFDRKGLLNAWLNGVPFAQRMALQQTEGEAPGATYTAVDYSLLAIGALGIGYTISQIVDQKDTRDPATAVPPAPPTGNAPAGGGGMGSPLAGGMVFMEERVVTPEYQRWLDSGTGQMGDLILIE